MNMSTYEPLDGIVVELIRRGLPAEYAQRAVDELADHHRDLLEELQAAGWTDSHAKQEASRRLGEPHKLAQKTIREYQRRYWCGRWPLITFLLGPIPAYLSVLVLSGVMLACVFWILGIDDEYRTTTPIDYVWAYGAKFWITLVAPLFVVAGYVWLAQRTALGRLWQCIAAGVLAVQVGFMQCSFQFPTVDHPQRRFTVGYHFWFVPECWNTSLLRFFWNNPWQIVQFTLPLAATGLLMAYSSYRMRSGWKQLAVVR
jgi:hypothetical protein